MEILWQINSDTIQIQIQLVFEDHFSEPTPDQPGRSGATFPNFTYYRDRSKLKPRGELLRQQFLNQNHMGEILELGAIYIRSPILEKLDLACRSLSII